MARPIVWKGDKLNDAIELVLTRISNGEGLRNILTADRDKDALPSSKLFHEWLIDLDGLSERYARACEERTELKFASIEKDYLEEPQRDPESGRIDNAWVALQRLKIDAKKWELSKLSPKKYSDKLQVDNTTFTEQPLFPDVSKNDSNK